jgi:hypothetical protein
VVLSVAYTEASQRLRYRVGGDQSRIVMSLEKNKALVGRWCVAAGFFFEGFSGHYGQAHLY